MCYGFTFVSNYVLDFIYMDYSIRIGRPIASKLNISLVYLFTVFDCYIPGIGRYP